ncbi:MULTISPECIES: phytanoyl-CoA dioxygenase family protein [unclassified Bradyrhizobium]|uniref:phytanoyl-CoA dioxygenase family protein n=1 Tax=unclassified Bradyrhizobium TaxID=2631580 RepID=UPI00291626E7|nr:MULTISPECIES: phytanoyl-CoA dioxygenase family protein [unclassified Bradyrhizobium]
MAKLKASYDTRGFALLEGLFDDSEIQLIRTEAEIPCSDASRVRFEKDQTSLYIRYGIHQDAQVFANLVRDIRCVGAASEALGSDVYLHQSKLNAKTAFTGSDFSWHQDLAYWKARDGIPEPQALSVALFVDDVTPVNAPLFVMPGSHAAGLLPTAKYDLSQQQVQAAASQFGIEAILGRRGTMLIFSSTLIHASPPNISPIGRRIIYLSYNAVSNVQPDTGSASADFLASSDFTPIVAEVGRLDRPARTLAAHN